MTSGKRTKPGRRFGIPSHFKRFLYSIFRSFFFIVLFINIPAAIYCRHTGFKHIKNYLIEDYGLEQQNWWILQDKQGLIYIANNGGLLEFDGLSWRNIKIPNTSVRSLTTTEDGTIYISGNSEIGFLAPDEKGYNQYVSLVPQLSDREKNFSNVWTTRATKDGVYFSSYEFLFRWDPAAKQFKTWQPEPDNRFFLSFTHEGEFYIDQENVGLMRMENDSLKLVPGGEFFAEKTIYLLLPYYNRELLIGTGGCKLYIYDGKSTRLFSTEMDNYLKEKQLYRGIRLSSGSFALTTLHGGLVIIDARGKIKEIFTKSAGVRDDNIKYVFEDRQGNLWLALEKGITKIEYKSPISFYNETSGLDGLILSVTKCGDTLYAGTTNGLYYLDRETGTLPLPDKFQRVPKIIDSCRSLLSLNESLLAATYDGVYLVENNSKKVREVLKESSHTLLRSTLDKNRIWIGTEKGLFTLYRKKNGWVNDLKLENVTHPIHTIVEEENGNLWLGTLTGRMFHVSFSAAGTIDRHEVHPFSEEQGLPSSGEIHVFKAAGHTMFASAKGILRFDEEKKIFLPDGTFGTEFACNLQGRTVYRIVEDKRNHIWLHSEGRSIRAIPRPDGTFALLRNPFQYFAGDQPNTIYPDPASDVTWFACNERLICYHPANKNNSALTFKTLIRQVSVNGTPVFGGHNINEGSPPAAIDSKLTLDNKENNIGFKFSAPFYEREAKTKYRCRLAGCEKKWCEWRRETQKDYTNLDAGTYTFHVQAKNTYENVSDEALFRFTILLPWYQSWWAYMLFILILFLLIFLIMKWWRSGKLEREKQKLERIVKERIKEIEEKNKQLEQQTLQLKEQSEKLKEMDKVKSRFFANISHEFRTPLTLIMGPIEQMLSNKRDEEEKKKLKLILRNSQRLLSLINQLLELSKFESGKMKLHAVYQDIVPFLKGIVGSFDSLANKNELDLTLQSEEEHIDIYFDPGKLEEIVFNLLSNAVKFTPSGGKINISVKKTPGGEGHFPSGALAISVSDTGPGIRRDQLEFVFDHFYQSDSSFGTHRKGSGIGLAIAKDLVKLHHGSIDVHSSEGRGTEFIIRLPMGKDHLQPDEIIEILAPVSLRKIPSENEDFYSEDDTAGSRDRNTYLVENENNPLPGEHFKPGATEKNIILVVEDNADVRDYIRGALEPTYEVVEAEDGRQGILKAQKIIPDLIISDIMMPQVDGCELCRLLKNDITTSHIPIILLSARASEDSIIHGLETGADDYITKPFNTRILCIRIRNLIELRSHLQQTLNREMTLQPVKISVPDIDKKFIKKLQKIINENIADPGFNIELLCKKMEMSQPSLYRKIIALSGESPTEFIRSYRLKRGAELLKSNFGSVLEVAFEVGFSSANYFTKCFKKKFHQLPSTFRETG